MLPSAVGLLQCRLVSCNLFRPLALTDSQSFRFTATRGTRDLKCSGTSNEATTTSVRHFLPPPFCIIDTDSVVSSRSDHESRHSSTEPQRDLGPPLLRHLRGRSPASQEPGGAADEGSEGNEFVPSRSSICLPLLTSIFVLSLSRVPGSVRSHWDGHTKPVRRDVVHP